MRISALLGVLPLVASAVIQQRARIIEPHVGDLIPGRYIVKVKPNLLSDLWNVINSCLFPIAATADVVFDELGAFSVFLSPFQLLYLSYDPYVAYIEQEAFFGIFDTQGSAPWDLARLSNTQRGSYTYTYDDTAGTGACAYVIDTGVDTTHPEFEGRATFLKSFNNNATNTGDANGHGTAVAGIIVAKTYGVAKKARVLSVTVLNSDGSGTTSAILAGMNYVVTDARTRSGCTRGFVVNMSLGGGFSQSLNDASASIVNSGLFLTVAAGNGDSTGKPVDVSTVSPASAPLACTIGATDINDRVASFSNYGSLLDIYAPGVGILTTLPNSKTGYQSGTSMASPIIAGVGAYHLGLGSSNATNMCTFICSKALSNVAIGVPSGTSNLLAQNTK